MQTALVIEGGAMRSTFASGVVDGFIERDFDPFDLYLGVSGGVFNLAAFLAGQQGLGLKILLELALHPNFISYRRFLAGADLINLDWLMECVASEPYLDVAKVFDKRKLLIAGVTAVDSGKAVYVRAAPQNLLQLIKASMALPLMYRRFPRIDGRAMTDGGVADGIPLRQAILMGAKQIMVIRSRHHDFRKTDTLGHRWIRWKLRRHPALVAKMKQRITLHEQNLALLRQPPPGISIVDIAPPPGFQAGRFSRSREALLSGYEAGRNSAPQAMDHWLDIMAEGVERPGPDRVLPNGKSGGPARNQAARVIIG